MPARHDDAARFSRMLDDTVTIEGWCHPRFAAVAEAFARNFTDRDEAGASVALVHDGRLVVDLWGGAATADRPWQADDLVVVFSATKAATALSLHLLAERGRLDLDRPVAGYWPEFAGNGKDRATVRMILDHTIGLPVLRPQLKADCITDAAYMIDHLAAETPFWEPGTRTGYHPLTMGFLAAEVVHRVDGRSLGRFFAEEIAGPLGLDFWIGLPEEHEARVAPVIIHRPPRDAQATPFLLAAREPGSIANLFVFNSGDFAVRGVNTRAGHAAEIGAAGGITNARGLAGLYAALVPGGPLGFSADTLAGFAEASSATHLDATLLQPMRFGPGFMLRMDNRRRPQPADSLVIGHHAFGHVGAGGSVGFADPAAGIAFGYAMTRMGPGLLLNPRGQSLVDAAYAALAA